MKENRLTVNGIPAILYGDESEKLFLYVHGRYASKEEAERLAGYALIKGYQVLGFDLPEHGDRVNEDYKCNIVNCINDLQEIYEFIKPRWNDISLFACSLGAFFSLMSFRDVVFSRCLFLSPVLDMERVIKNMMLYSGVTEEILKEKKEIPTEFGETLDWNYYQYVKENPVDKWKSPVSILYGEKDSITEKDVLELFVKKYNCGLQVMKGGHHYFNTDYEIRVLNKWIQDGI